ncbi:MAG: ABC transporter permease, partial [Gammaproteobacteria bacterium]
MKGIFKSAVIAASVMTAGVATAAAPLKIGHVYGISGAFEKYARTLKQGIEM